MEMGLVADVTKIDAEEEASNFKRVVRDFSENGIELQGGER